MSKDIQISIKKDEIKNKSEKENKKEIINQNDTRDTNGNYYICIGI